MEVIFKVVFISLSIKIVFNVKLDNFKQIVH